MKKRIFYSIIFTAVFAAVGGSAITWLVLDGRLGRGAAFLLPAGGLFLLLLCLAYGLSALIVHPVLSAAAQLKKQEKPDLDKLYDELLVFEEIISVQKSALDAQERRIEDESNKLSAITRNMSEGLILLDNEQNVLLANESARKYLRANPALDGGAELYISRNPDFNRCIEEAYAGHDMYVYIQQGGRQLQVIANPVIHNGEQAGIICLILDVTEKMEIERMKHEFTANVSHELKTPLTSISGYAEMIENGMATGEHVAEFAGRIRREASRLLTLISDIIKLSELDERESSKAFTDVDLLEIAKECVERLSISAEQHKVTLSVGGVSTLVRGDADMLSEMVFNLCDNAIRYNRDNGFVYILTGNHAITVTDTGIGIPEEHQAYVFERFYRVDKSRSKKTGGTGLGLAIVKHIAEQHGAKIELSSIPGTGTEIKVLFPAGTGSA